MRKRSRGLRRRGDVWHLNGIRIKGYGALYESTGESDLAQAEKYRDHRVRQIKDGIIYGVRPSIQFRDAAAHYLETQTKKSLVDEVIHLDQAVAIIGDTPLHLIHDETLRPFVAWCKKRGNKSKTIKLKLGVIRRILNLCATMYRDKASGLTWLQAAPKLTMPTVQDAKPPYPLTWEEHRLLFPEFPEHLGRMALFAVNTGCRDAEVCGLRWDMEQRVLELGVSVFVLPPASTKNRRPKVVVLNAIAAGVIEQCRGEHSGYVFTYPRQTGRAPVTSMLNTAWVNARDRAADKYRERIGKAAPDGFKTLTPHALRHTFSRRLRALGVAHETRQDLLGHVNRNITTEYSGAELRELLEAVRKLEAPAESAPALTLLRIA